MDSVDLHGLNPSLFDDLYPASVATRVYEILQDPIDWNTAYHRPDYMDMVKVRYRTFQVECPKSEIVAKLPSMFAKEFAFEMYRYNRVVDRYGNDFEVITEKANGALCFTHGWSSILDCYVDTGCKGAWASITYIRPKLFVLVLKDRYYRDLLAKQLYPSLYLNLSRTLFGSDQNPSWFGNIPVPYCHESGSFTHHFIVILTDSDVTAGLLVINYGVFARKHIAKDADLLILIDDSGLEWRCTVKFHTNPFDRFEIGGDWRSLVRMRNYQIGDHIMFGSFTNEITSQLFVKRV